MTESTDDWIQVDAGTHYDPLVYLAPQRMASIAYQYTLMAKHFPGSRILEVGVGAGLTTTLLRKIGHEVATLDVDPELKPDLLGSVTEIPSAADGFDTVLCSQVLEHIPWDSVGMALREIARVAKVGAVISVPTNQPTWLFMKYDSKSYGTRRIRLGSRIRKPMRVRNGEHHWELEANVRTKSFRSLIVESGFEIENEIQPVENMFHHFLVIRKIKP